MSLRVGKGPSIVLGGCNACTKHDPLGIVYTMRGEGRTVEYRLCQACLLALKAATPDIRVPRQIK